MLKGYHKKEQKIPVIIFRKDFDEDTSSLPFNISYIDNKVDYYVSFLNLGTRNLRNEHSTHQ